MVRSLDFIFHALLPKDKKFYPLFDQAIENLITAAKTFESSLKVPSERQKAREILEKLEKKGDDITHAIMHEAASTFIVPFDREDIQQLAIALDDIIDFIFGTSRIIDLYEIDEITPDMIRLSEIIVESSIELQGIISELRSLKNIRKVNTHIDRIELLEREADDILNQSTVRLFEEEKDAMLLLKKKEVISFLETATDKCKEATYVLESVVIKFS